MQFNLKNFYFVLCCVLQFAVNFFMLSRAWDAPPVAAIVPAQILCLIVLGIMLSSRFESHRRIILLHSGIVIVAVGIFSVYHVVQRGYRFWEFPATYRAVPLHVAVAAVYFLSLLTIDAAVVIFKRRRSPYQFAQLLILTGYSVYTWRYFL